MVICMFYTALSRDVVQWDAGIAVICWGVSPFFLRESVIY